MWKSGKLPILTKPRFLLWKTLKIKFSHTKEMLIIL